MLEHQERQYSRYQLAWVDLLNAGRLVEFILKNRLYDDRRIKRTTERVAFHTALAVVYARPFTKARGFAPLPGKVLKNLTPEQRGLHDAMIYLRNQVFAHTDADHFVVTTLVFNGKVEALATIPRITAFGMEKEALEALHTIIELLKDNIRQRQAEIERGLVNNQNTESA